MAQAKRKKCQHCGKLYSTVRGGLVNHERACPANPERVHRKYRRSTVDGEVPKVEEAARNFGQATSSDLLDIAVAAKKFFPQGIKTDDPEALARTLEWLRLGVQLAGERQAG